MNNLSENEIRNRLTWYYVIQTIFVWKHTKTIPDDIGIESARLSFQRCYDNVVVMAIRNDGTPQILTRQDPFAYVESWINSSLVTDWIAIKRGELLCTVIQKDVARKYLSGEIS